MYSWLSPASQQQYSEDQFVSSYEQVVREAGILTVAPRILAAYQPDTQAKVAFAVTFGTALVGEFEVQNHMNLSLVEGRWGVDWSPALIFPQLSDDTIVSLTKQLPARGNIYDRTGLGLAVQGELVEVGVVPSRIEDETALLDSVSAILQKSPADLRARYTGVNPDWYVPLGQISAEKGQAHYETLAAMPGVEQRRMWTRAYRQELIGPHLVGVVGPIPLEEVDWWRAQGYDGDEIVGRMGLERWGEPFLAGKPGAQLAIVTPQGRQVAILASKPPQESSSLHATFDRQFQKEVQDILGEQVGAIAVLEANTGRVLALATYPTFDPRPLAAGMSEQDWSALEDDPGRPLVNRATQGVYPAGSVFKIVTMAAGMEAGGLTKDSGFTCHGTWTGLGPELPKRCWLSSGHGQIPLGKALTVSCDITFYQVGVMLNDLNPEVLPDYARRFGLGARTGVQLEEEAGLVPSPSWKIRAKGEGWATGDAVNLSIGQSELLTTPLQIAAMLAAVGNGGTVYRPSIVEMIASDPDNPDWVLEPVAVAQLPVSEENLAVIQASLHGVTSAPNGTAYEAFEGFGLPVAGKTGTAESGHGEPHAWFAGYAPASQPEIAIAVIVEYGGGAAERAAPLFRRVTEAYFGNVLASRATATPPPVGTPSTP
jgi:penicillin-binding protein 2